MSQLSVHAVPVLEDNYVFILFCKRSRRAVVVDPGVSAPVVDFLRNNSLQLESVWNTHHHHDHTGGNRELKAETGCQIIGSREDEARIPGIDKGVGDSEQFCFLGETETVRVIGTPGHTKGAVSYLIPSAGILFSGDTLFAMGCGRLFEGTPEEMLGSLSRLSSLDPETKIYCAHEYTQRNSEFALSVDSSNAVLQRRARKVRETRRKGQSTVPTVLREELLTNPFLRCEDESIRACIGCSGRSNLEVFAKLRSERDLW